MATATKNVVTLQSGQMSIDGRKKTKVKTAVLAFLDVAGSGTGRSTFYNTREEQQAAIKKVHENLFKLDRGLYGMLLLLPGAMDYSKQLGISQLLSHRRMGDFFLTEEQEKQAIRFLVDNVPVTRVLRLFEDLRHQRVNNARTAKLILGYILDSNKLALWSVKYRAKLRTALEHAWNKRRAGILRSILAKSRTNAKEKSIVQSLVDHHTTHDANEVRQCVAFILGADRTNYTVPMLKAFYEARTDLSAGKILPMEILDGIRQRYHGSVEKAEVIKLTKDKMSSGQKMAVQRQAKKAGVQVDFDPTKQDAVKLYKYAFEEGMTDAIQNALLDKARSAASSLPFAYRDVGIVLDASLSMFGKEDNKLQPMAVALATRDMLVALADRDESGRAVVEVCGRGSVGPNGLIKPSGETNLAKCLVKVVKEQPEAIFIISDGYENAPAGRVNEVIGQLRKLGIETPIFQLTPVMAAESAGIRSLSDGLTPMPVARPDSMGITLVRGLLEQDIERGLNALASMALPRIGVE